MPLLTAPVQYAKLITFLLACAYFSPSFADEYKAENTATEKSETQFLIVGPALTPQYQGSEDYDTVPMVVAQFDLGSAAIEIEGLSTRAAFFKSEQWRFGICADFDFGRDEEVDAVEISQLGKIDGGIHFGLYGQRNFKNALFEDDEFSVRLSFVTDAANQDQGSYSSLSLTYTPPLILPWRLEFELEGSYADDEYMQEYFGISKQDASTSGLPPYQASASLRDLRLNTNVILFSSPKWGSYVRLSFGELLGDAAKSPLTKLGSKQQYFFGIGAFYRFGEAR